MLGEIKEAQAIQGQKLDVMSKSVEQLREAILGDGSEQKPGLHMRVDRLEQKERLKGKMLWTVATATFGLIVKTVWGWLK